ncbi:MAG: NADAR family protein [Gordonia sp. (in: high G+C Gram-positive bacteria)]
MIGEFRGSYRFLSNFYPAEVAVPPMSWPGGFTTRGPITFGSAEAAFQAGKCVSVSDVHRLAAAETPGEAKAIGRRVVLTESWDLDRLGFMALVVGRKFRPDTPLAERLLATGDHVLVEGNDWHDQFWGTCVCARHDGVPGQNWLGTLLTQRRAYLRGDTAGVLADRITTRISEAP